MLGAQKAKPAEQLAGFYRSGGSILPLAVRAQLPFTFRILRIA